MGGPLSVTFSDIYIIKMVSEIVIPQNLYFIPVMLKISTVEEKRLSMMNCLKS